LYDITSAEIVKTETGNCALIHITGFNCDPGTLSLAKKEAQERHVKKYVGPNDILVSDM
jgi:hypothetical protein